MDGSAYLLFLLVCAASGQPMVEDGASNEPPASEQSVADEVSSPIPTTTTERIDTADEPLNCTTARDLPGNCVARASCEHSTTAIDFTLYAPQGYVKICKTDEVCCPTNYLGQHQEVNNFPQASNNGNEEAFEFDDDD